MIVLDAVRFLWSHWAAVAVGVIAVVAAFLPVAKAGSADR